VWHFRDNEGFSQMHKPGVVAITTIAFVFVASPTFAGETAYIADLKGAFEVPPTDSKATGKGNFTYDGASKKLTWTITYSGLSAEAKAAHLHGPAKEGENAGPMITLSPLQSPIKGAAILTEDQVKALTGGNMYVNVHTAQYPDGEIRGQVKPAS
jgi:hypothetical protein